MKKTNSLHSFLYPDWLHWGGNCSHQEESKMKHLEDKRDHKSHKSMSRPHGDKKNKQRVDKKHQRQHSKKVIKLENEK